jgi:hypothetical protein
MNATSKRGASKMQNEKRLQKEFDEYNTAIKIHTITKDGKSMTCTEVASGQIKINGTETFKNYEEMIGCLQDGAEIKTENV